MTLRLRLLLLLVGIVAAGLVISDVVTYNALRAFLITRVDQQLEVATFPVGRALASASGLGPSVPAAPPAGTATRNGVLGGTASVVPGAATSRPSGHSLRDPFRDGGEFFNPSGTFARGVLVPPGTYGQLRSSSGKIEAHLFFSYGEKAPSAPGLPARVPGSGASARSDLYFSTSSTGADAVSYRVLAKPLPHGAGTIIVAVPLADMNSTLGQLLLIEAIVSALVLMGLGFLSWAMVRRDLRPLEEITRTAGAIARGDLSQRVAYVSGATEVGQLGQAFNTMVDGIEVAFAERAASEDRLRRFLADASHELRTPLTSILGYAELFDLGVRDRPEDLAASMRYIKDEASRMGTLVDDLFLLAQLDHERPLHIEPVDLADVAHRAAAGLRASAPGRSVALEVDGPVMIDGDSLRIRQVIDNLLVNALTHAPGDSPIGLSVVEEDESAVIRVHDDGPGIEPGDASRIFEPFFRSDPSRARSSGGAGLGLAIVAAIVTAHHGTVWVEPGPGATFEVRLPRAGGAVPAKVPEAVVLSPAAVPGR
ncbi:MAG: HAMP domain-containing sensor histidine kinase [Acidimicrobiales bacterium]|jgi:two-component system OmpR family sensor kinase